LCEFHQTYNFGAVATKMNWLDFEVNRSKVKITVTAMHFSGESIMAIAYPSTVRHRRLSIVCVSYYSFSVFMSFVGLQILTIN